MATTEYVIEVIPRIPQALGRLPELAANLMYSWERQIRALFYRLDAHVWEASGHNPTVFLRRVDQQRLDAAAVDPVFLFEYERVLALFDAYLSRHQALGCMTLNPRHDVVAYFCAEYGLHESLPIYSGGLGILAGDHCKACSDIGVPFVAIGLLYRQGYFTQEIDAEGRQVARYIPTRFSDLPITPLKTPGGQPLRLTIPLPGRVLTFRAWQARIGHVTLFLLDTDIAENTEADRIITWQLYGGDRVNRLMQEILLGIGGVRLLRAVGIHPTVWHLNEGHACFSVIERAREYVQEGGWPFEAAWEATAAATVFTTHTPVPAGHDVFERTVLQAYFDALIKELGIDIDTFLALGESPLGADVFNMTALGLRGSRFHNGVSRIHREVASRMERYVWPEIPPDENPLAHVTNGVHIATFLASEWVNVFDLHFGSGWRSELTNTAWWNRISQLPDHTCWSVRQSLKARMKRAVQTRLQAQWTRNGVSVSQRRRWSAWLVESGRDPLVLGFARRFATYKRAGLLFSDLDRAAKLFNDAQRPVVMIMAGKAHPDDQPGQAVLRHLHEISQLPAFAGKLLLVENYDMALARTLVAGVDVWINTPAYPQEASGTSGQKAAINGVLNVSILDGWWGEGWRPATGWAITPHGAGFSAEFRDREEAGELLDLLEHTVVPLYFARNGTGHSSGWLTLMKSSMQALLPRFNAHRMVADYLHRAYLPASMHGSALTEFGGFKARELMTWKARIRERWSGVQIQRLDTAPSRMYRDDRWLIDIAVDLNGLHPVDIHVEALIDSGLSGDEAKHCRTVALHFARYLEDGRALYRYDGIPPTTGLLRTQLRAYPMHGLLAHRFEMGCMHWV